MYGRKKSLSLTLITFPFKDPSLETPAKDYLNPSFSDTSQLHKLHVIVESLSEQEYLAIQKAEIRVHV